MPEPAAAYESVAASVPRAPWEQQSGENDLWYARFLRYVALGPSRSVSLVAKGRRNAYPIPAHWPIQAKQHDWQKRAVSFDEAVRTDMRLLGSFNAQLSRFSKSDSPSLLSVNREGISEVTLLTTAVRTGGYQVPADEEAELASFGT